MSAYRDQTAVWSRWKPSRQAHVHQGLHGVDAVGVLGQAHGPDEHRLRSRDQQIRERPDRLARHAALRLDLRPVGGTGHREGVVEGFTSRYGCKLLVGFELHATVPEAIAHEKRTKAGSRKAKLKLIEDMNPEWRDLFEDIA